MVQYFVVTFRKIPEEFEWIDSETNRVYWIDIYPETLGGEEVVKFYCRNCSAEFYYQDDTAIFCPKCGSKEIIPMYG